MNSRKLYRVNSFGMKYIEYKSTRFHQGKVYARSELYLVPEQDLARHFELCEVELPNSSLPRELADVCPYCSQWIEFLLENDLAKDLANGQALLRPVIEDLRGSIKRMTNAPVPPSDRSVNYLCREISIEVATELKRYRDWSISATKCDPSPPRNVDAPRTKSPSSQVMSTLPTHSIDFASLEWFGTLYTFTPTQAACVRVLFEAWEKRAPVVNQHSILEIAGSSSERLRDVFGNGSHPAWKSLIVPCKKGTFRLTEPK